MKLQLKFLKILNICLKHKIYYFNNIQPENLLMQNNPPLILSRDAVNQPNQKYKFWDSSITENLRQPQNMSLVTESKLEVTPVKNTQNFNQQSSHLTSQQDDDISDFGQNSESSPHKLRIKALQKQIQDIRGKYQKTNALNQNLVVELNKTTNSLKESQTMNQKLNAECDRLYANVKATHDKFSEIQNQKMEFMIQMSALNQQKQIAINKAEIFEQQVQYLNKKMESFQEDNSFQKSMSNDLKREALVLKEQLNKMLVMMQNYSELQEEVNRTHSINTQIQQRVIKLEEQLKETRLKVQESEANEQRYMQQQNKLFLKIQQYESENKILNEKILLIENQLKAKNQQVLTVQTKQNDYQSRYVKILSELSKRNEDLIYELIASQERNHKLLDERDFYAVRVEAFQNNRNQRLPYDQFVSILNAKDSQVQILRKKLQLKQDEIDQLKTQFENQELNLKTKIGELGNLVQIRERQIGNREEMTQNEINIYKKQYELILKRNEEIKNSQVKMRLEIIEKDRIIMDFIERQKIQNRTN